MSNKTATEVATKVCYECRREKPITEFGVNERAKLKIHSLCKQCNNHRAREWYKCHKEKRGIAVRKWSYSPKGLFNKLRFNARKRNHSFDLTREEFVAWLNSQKRICYYCGIPLKMGAYRRNKLTFDRKDNGQGYSLDNIVLCCFVCNNVKSDIFTDKEMLEIAERYIKPKLEVVHEKCY